MDDLKGKVAIVTGAGMGIGKGMAIAYGRAGVKVAVVSRTKATVDEVAQLIRDEGGEAIGITADVGVRQQVFDTVDQVVKAFGTVDILVNNAQSFGKPAPGRGNDHTQPVETFDEEDWEIVHRTGLMATLWAMKAVFPHMKGRGGKIINMGSAAGQLGLEGFAAYASNKEGIRALTRVAAREWGKHHINVNVINAGILTEKIKDQYGDKPEAMQAMTQRPASRTGDPINDAGGLAKFLASKDSDYLTGMTFMLDGGRFMFP